MARPWSSTKDVGNRAGEEIATRMWRAEEIPPDPDVTRRGAWSRGYPRGAAPQARLRGVRHGTGRRPGRPKSQGPHGARHLLPHPGCASVHRGAATWRLVRWTHELRKTPRRSTAEEAKRRSQLGSGSERRLARRILGVQKPGEKCRRGRTLAMNKERGRSKGSREARDAPLDGSR